MKVIQEPNQGVFKVWGKQKTKDVPYRLMRFVLRLDVEEGVLLYNLVTGELLLTEAEDRFMPESSPAASDDAMNLLIEKHFMVPVAYDEQKAVNRLREILHRLTDNYTDGIIGCTIMPTSHCNARCFYCFESDFRYSHMSEETADQVVEYLDKHCNKKRSLQLTWFGGEPTVGEKRMDQICRGLQEKGIEYTAFMYSNGYLFDDEMVKKAVDLWKLHKIQITLDGTEEVYNRIKAYKAVKGSAFRRVLDNIERLLDAGLNVMIRMNMDFYNCEDLKQLILELSERFSRYENISAYVSVLFDDEGFDKVTHTHEDRVLLEQKKIELEKLIASGGLAYSKGSDALACLKTVSCCADNDESVLINPDGGIAKCDHSPYDLAIGSVWSDEIDAAKYREIKKGYEAELCRTCPVYPTCYNLKICNTSDCCNEVRMEAKRKEILRQMEKRYLSFKSGK